MTAVANPARGEGVIVIDGVARVVRPSFAALVAAEAETGPLLALAERAAEGAMTLAEIEALVWHCLAERPADLSRERVGEALLALGVPSALPLLRLILRQILTGGA